MSQASDNVQGKKEQKHTLRFCFNSDPDPVFVSCNTSMTVLDALNTSDTFRVNKNVNDMKKEIFILRADGAAVKTDFPCCLIEKNEIITITFIAKKKDHSTEEQTHEALSLPRTDLITFKIKTTGGKGVKYIMKNNELRKRADCVCVYAMQGEEVETALERDGRFTYKIFQKHCVLESLKSDSQVKLGHETRYEMSQPVEHLNKKTFQIIAVGASCPDSQKELTEVKTESDEALAVDSEKYDPGKNPISTEQKQTLHNKESTSLSTKWLIKTESKEALAADSEKYDPGQNPITSKHKETFHNKEFTSLSRKWSIIPYSKEILQILRNQHKDYLKTLMEHKKLSNNFQVQTVYTVEYDNSVQHFSKVSLLKQLAKLSDSVCQIRLDGIPKGTGFLLCGQFILTNAHVVQGCLEAPEKLCSIRKLEAVFDFDYLDSNVKLVPFKKDIAASYFITHANNSRLDFALLELEATNEITGRPELLSCYSPGPPPNRGGICIVGHPDGGIKRIDHGFIIGKENLLQATVKHISENVKFIHVISQYCLSDQWKTYENQITYDSCFFHGTSGSPVFDEHLKLIGMHTGGYVYGEEGDQARSIMEYSYSMQPILDMIRGQAKIRGRRDILRDLDRSSVPGFAEQQNQEDYEMEDVESLE